MNPPPELLLVLLLIALYLALEAHDGGPRGGTGTTEGYK